LSAELAAIARAEIPCAATAEELAPPLTDIPYPERS
jgi:hypothetical protein